MSIIAPVIWTPCEILFPTGGNNTYTNNNVSFRKQMNYHNITVQEKKRQIFQVEIILTACTIEIVYKM